jgi:hypothetical protein
VIDIAYGAGLFVTSAYSFGSGHIWAFYEQSNGHRTFSTGFPGPAAEPVAYPNSVQIFTVSRPGGGATRTLLTDASPLSASSVAFANTFHAVRPGEKLALLAHTDPGTSPSDMVNNAGSRFFSDEQALHNRATQDGQSVGLVFAAWFEWNASTANPDIFMQVMTGRDINGTPVPQGTVIFSTHALDNKLGTIPGDADWGTEFYDWDYSRFALIGPHGRGKGSSVAAWDNSKAYKVGEHATNDENDVHAWRSLVANNLNNALPSVGNSDANWQYEQKQTFDYTGANNLTFEAYMDALRELPDNPNFTFILPYPGFEHFVTATGQPTGTKWWGDFSHKSEMDDLGSQKLGSYYAISALQSLGSLSLPDVSFNYASWEPAGAYADFGILGYDMTTERRLAGLPAIPTVDNLGNPLPHRTEVMGMAINNLPAENVVIAEGAGPSGEDVIRVFPNSGVFDYTTIIDNMQGQYGGFVQYPDDYIDSFWLNLPIVDVGQPRINGLSPKARTAAALTNPYPAPPSFTTAVAGPRYELGNTSTEGQTTGQITWAFKGKVFSPDGGNQAMVTFSATHMDIHRTSGTGVPRATIKDSAGATLLSAASFSTLSIPTDVISTIICSIDLVAQTIDIWVDGVNEQKALAANTGTFATNRQVLLLARTNTGGFQWVGECDYAKIWYNTHITNGVEPTATPDVELTGPAATANAFRGKLGADAT